MKDEATIERMREAVVRDAPFAHAVVDGFLEPDLFAALRRAYPDPATMPAVKDRRDPADDAYSDRRVSLKAEDLADVEDVESGTRPFARLLELVKAQAFGQALVGRFADTVQRELGRYRGRNLVLRTSTDVIVDRTGFALRPHTDGNSKVATVLVYLADPGDPAEHGTRLYAPKDPAMRCESGALLHPFEEFDEAGIVPYRPNTAVMFARTGNSFHGVAASSSEIPRRLLQIAVVLAGERTPG